MPVKQPGQRNEVAAGQRQERYVWREFLQRQAAASYQKHEKAFHHFPRNLTIAWAVNA
jgi:hypothetical protein